MAERRMPLAAIISAVREGMVYEVTHHQDPLDPERVPDRNPWPGRVIKVDGFSIHMVHAAGEAGKREMVALLRADQAELDPDGTIRLYGGGAGQEPGDLFLTLAPVTG
jgi:hypothetical protein